MDWFSLVSALLGAVVGGVVGGIVTYWVNTAGGRRDRMVKAAEMFLGLSVDIATEYARGDAGNRVSMQDLERAGTLVDLYSPKLSAHAWALIEQVRKDRPEGRSTRQEQYDAQLGYHKLLDDYEARMRDALGLDPRTRSVVLAPDRLDTETRLRFALTDDTAAYRLRSELEYYSMKVEVSEERSAAGISGTRAGRPVKLFQHNSDVVTIFEVSGFWLTPEKVREYFEREGHVMSTDDIVSNRRIEMCSVVELPVIPLYRPVGTRST